MAGFLSQDIGGYAEGPMQNGQAGVPKTGINWADILGAAMQYGSKQGSSAPAFGSLMQQQYGGMGQQTKQTPQQNAGIEPLMNTNQKKQSSSDAMIMQLLQAFGMGG